jgi:adenine-specific DNA methylase
MEDKRLIEVDFPLKEVSEESASEKSIRFGHISTLHIWWARKPLAASRATIFTALTRAENGTDLQKKLDFVTKLSRWKNALNYQLIKQARNEIKQSFGGKPPKVLDCFAGGGSIPLEALRLGCETYALELNPVAVLILKAVTEYPQRFSNENSNLQKNFKEKKVAGGKLLEDIQKWANWVVEKAKDELLAFYPEEKDRSISIGYLWTKMVKCENPSCKADIPTMWRFWLSENEKKKVALKIIVNKMDKQVNFHIVKGKAIDFDPSEGTARKGGVVCPICGSALSSDAVRRQFMKGKVSERQVAVITHNKTGIGKDYRIPNDNDLNAVSDAKSYLEKKVRDWRWDFRPIPDEPISAPNGQMVANEPHTFFVHLQSVLYGMSRWGDLFNDRQKLALITFVEKVRLAHDEMIRSGYEPEYAKAITTYLGLAIGRLADKNANQVIYNTIAEKIEHVFGRLAIAMAWGYVEVNPFTEVGWSNMIDWILRAVEHCSNVSDSYCSVTQGTATNLPYPSESFDAIITDPPYYDNVPYADLADFFYVWLKRVLDNLYPELFSTPLTPKTMEIIQNSTLVRRGSQLEVSGTKGIKTNVKDRVFFEREITKAFKEINRVLKSNGVAVIVFAHKSTEAWETIVNSLLKAGLVLSASWPVHTEKRGRLRAQESAALASSIYMVCRKRASEEIAYFNEIKDEINKRIKQKLDQFWKQGISGADFFISAIGPAVEVFGKYSKVEKLSGEEVSVQELLEYVRKVVSEFALERVLKRADLGGVDSETRFYLLWRWTFNNAKVHFDDAIKLSRPMGIELTRLWDGGGFVKKEKEFIRVLDPKERAKDPAFLRRTKFTSMIDVLHHVAILWERGERERMKEVLNETGYAGNEIFWQTAQAISEILPSGDKEKQLLQGFLYGKEVYIREAARGKKTLLDFTERG